MTASSQNLTNHVVVWKHGVFPKQATRALASWEQFHTVLFTDDHCESLARQWGCGGYFRTDLMNITRADICRYMATWDAGGVYSDLDVNLLRKFDARCSDLCVAREFADGKHYGNHFFIAARQSPCLQRAIRHSCQRAMRTHMDFRIDPHVIHHIAGPYAFDKAVRGCAAQMSRPAPFYTHHLHASVNWHRPGLYNGWMHERMKRAKWTHVYQHR